MATRGEHNLESHRQLAILDNTWRELFLQGAEEAQTARSEQDMNHPPRALGAMLLRMVDECVDGINIQIQHALEAGQMRSEETTEYSFNAFCRAAIMIGNRMFLMGQRLTTELPYADLTPCSCSILYDEDLDDLLRNAVEEGRQLEGPGWVIKDFGKEGEA